MMPLRCVGERRLLPLMWMVFSATMESWSWPGFSRGTMGTVAQPELGESEEICFGFWSPVSQD